MSARFLVSQAHGWYADGAASCDAMRFARSPARGVMLTFDAAFCKSAQRVAGSELSLTFSSYFVTMRASVN